MAGHVEALWAHCPRAQDGKRPTGAAEAVPVGRSQEGGQARSKRSASITLTQALTKSFTNFSPASSAA